MDKFTTVVVIFATQLTSLVNLRMTWALRLQQAVAAAFLHLLKASLENLKLDLVKHYRIQLKLPKFTS